jgi:hypothetical protein
MPQRDLPNNAAPRACLLLLIFVVIDRGVLLIVSELGAAQFLKSTLGPTPAPKSLARERALGLRKFYVKNSSDKKAIKEWYDPTCRVAPLARVRERSDRG